MWEQAGRPNGADFSNDARQQLQQQLQSGKTVQDLEQALKGPKQNGASANGASANGASANGASKNGYGAQVRLLTICRRLERPWHSLKPYCIVWHNKQRLLYVLSGEEKGKAYAVRRMKETSDNCGVLFPGFLGPFCCCAVNMSCQSLP